MLIKTFSSSGLFIQRRKGYLRVTEHTEGLTKPYNNEAMKGEGHRTEGELKTDRVPPTMRLECTSISCVAVARHRTPLMDSHVSK